MALNRNATLTLAASSAHASGNPETFTPLSFNTYWRGVHVIVDVTVLTSGASLVFKIQGVDPASAKAYDILVATAIVATGTNVFKVYPGITGVSGGSASDHLPATWKVLVTPADNKSVTYSVSAVLLV